MAKNYTVYELVNVIRTSTDNAELVDAIRRYPRLAVLAKSVNDAGMEILQALPEFLTARKVNKLLAGDNVSDEVESDSDSDDEDEKPVKKAKKAEKKPVKKSKKVEDDDEDDEDEDEDERPTKKSKKPTKKAKKSTKNDDDDDDDDDDGFDFD